MKRRIVYFIYIIWCIIAIYGAKVTAQNFGGFLFKINMKTVLLPLLIVIFVVSLLMRFLVRIDIRSLFLHLFLLLMYIPMIIYTVSLSFNHEMFTSYNLTLIVIIVAMYTGPNLKLGIKLKGEIVYNTIILLFLLLSFLFFILAFNSGVIRYIVYSGLSYDVYTVRDLFSSQINNKLLSYLYANYLIFLGPFSSILFFIKNKNKKSKYIIVFIYLINIVFSGHKSPFIYLSLVFVIGLVDFDRINTKAMIKSAATLLFFLSIFIFVLSLMYNIPFKIYFESMFFRRTLYVPIRIAEAYFLEFTNNLEFTKFSKILRRPILLPGNIQSLPYYIANKYFNSKAYMNTNFIAEAYINLGYLSVFIYSFILGKILKSMDLIIRKQNKLKKNIYYASVIPPILALVNTSFTTVLFSFGLFAAYIAFVLSPSISVNQNEAKLEKSR